MFSKHDERKSTLCGIVAKAANENDVTFYEVFTLIVIRVTKPEFFLIGSFLSDDEARSYPDEQKVNMADWNAPKLAVIVPSALRQGLSLRTELICPVGPHQEPGLADAVHEKCQISPSADVIVQCTAGHWAKYPCIIAQSD